MTGEAYYNAVDTAYLMMRLMALPADASLGLARTVEGYADIAGKVMDQYKNSVPGSVNKRNQYALCSMLLGSCAVSMARGVAREIIDSERITRDEAVRAIESLLGVCEEIAAFLDGKAAESAFADSDAEGYSLWRGAVFSYIDAAMDAVQDLAIRKSAALGEDRHFIELCYELYGSVDDDTLDMFILENKFNLGELEMIPAGREVAWHV